MSFTGRALDAAIAGPGWFAVQGAGGEGYTRAGNFAVSALGQLQTQDGRDVLYHIADNAGLGVIQAASDEGIFVIGWGKDQTDVAADAVMASHIVDQTAMIVDAVTRIVGGERSGETTFYGLDTAVTGLTAISSIVPNAAEVQAAVDALSASIVSGELKIAYNPSS